ncbi:unnamed protein product [Rotaria sp. Silwood1]|nr:unnamed protein product [Rotaria sp. Silwood1]CAF3665156.1 unnamed protein product [Rotaria sp. Silwood1]CAF3667911.1 unnamed protein product [Rotaria sp. Silwood1]CAF4752538.1 unnamed protein product [Rotaria sp. Silwood1]CAF4789987.1 unnamed protein product [Rotaria sp. Silwood1]
MHVSTVTDSKETESNRADESSELLTYRLANISDCESISILVNGAYRGESSRQGWTSEYEFVGGQRIDPDTLIQMITSDGSVILLFFDRDTKVLIGCVMLQDTTKATNTHLGCCIPLHQNTEVKKVLLSMLTVRPDLQTRGYGKFIISVAENFARHHWHAQLIEMSVLAHRTELIAYYIRRGYNDTGRRQPYSMNDVRFGIPKKNDLEICILAKSL